MGYLASRCESCGGMVDSDSCRCIQCGAVLKSAMAKSNYTPPSGLGNMSYEVSKNNENTFNHAPARSESIEEPYLWMFVLSVFYPVLQWILMGVYVSKNDFRSAWRLWIVPLVFQLVLIGGLLLFVAVASQW